MAAVFLAAGLALAAAGCSGQPVTSRASVEACTQFAAAAVRHHVTVTSLPPACRGLTNAQVSFAVGSALHSAAIGAGGKVQQRDAIGKANQYLEHLAVTGPAQRSEPQVLASPASSVSRTTLGLLALGAWLITVALGLWMMARWILRTGARRRLAGRIRRPPALNFAHLGLASTSLLIWIAYLATGVIGLAWTACALLALVTGLGMTLVFLPPSGGHPSHRRRAFTVGAHIVFASATILLAVLTAIGAG